MLALSPLFGPLCAPCHGERGAGDGPAADLMWPHPAPLNGPLRLSDPARRIREGVPGTAMPAFKTLSAADRATLLADLRHLGAREPAPVPVPPPPADLAALAPHGARLWQAEGCAGCHDERAALTNADGGPADQYALTRHPLKGGDHPADLYRAITRGRPGTPMPGRPDLAPADRWALVGYLRTQRGIIEPRPGLPPRGAPRVAREDLWGTIPTPSLATAVPILQSRRADQCGRCHPQIHAAWAESRHALATGPGLLGQYHGRPARFARGCDRCHAPQAASPSDPAHADGVSCVGCHVRAHGKLTARASDGPPGLPLRPTPRLQRSDFCMPCHALPLSAAVAGRPLLDTWREWAASPYLPAGIQCQHCHLGGGDHRMAGAHDAAAVRRAVAVTTTPPQVVDGQLEVTITVRNVGAGHHFPTTATPRAVLRVRQRRGGERLDTHAALWAIGRTVEHDQAGWREVADTRIPAGGRLQRTYRAPRLPGVDRLEIDLHLFPDWFYTRAFAAWLKRDDLSATARAAYAEALRAGEASVIRVDWRVLSLP